MALSLPTRALAGLPARPADFAVYLASRDCDRVLVEIGDNDPGIPEAAAAHILEPFYTTKPAGQGTGLGSISAGGSSSGATATCFPRRPGDTRLQVLLPAHPERVTPGPGAQTGSQVPPWAATAQITKTSKVMSSDQNG